MDMTRPEFGVKQCCLRLKRLQAALPDETEGLLLVGGLDGQYNIGTSQALGYLLIGRSNRDVADACHVGGGFDDTILLLKRDAVLAYAPDAAIARKLREMLISACISDLEIFAPTAEEAADPDMLEDHKIASLVQMLRGMSTLAIPYGSPAQDGRAGRTADPMRLEAWPLLQAYGLEGVGRGGFFTQNFKVPYTHACPCATETDAQESPWCRPRSKLRRLTGFFSLC